MKTSLEMKTLAQEVGAQVVAAGILLVRTVTIPMNIVGNNISHVVARHAQVTMFAHVDFAAGDERVRNPGAHIGRP